MSKYVFSNKESLSLLAKIQFLSSILESTGTVNYKELGLVSCFYNTIPTRLLCAKCFHSKNRMRSRIYHHCKSASHHHVKVHTIDADDFPTVDQSLRLIELHSIMLQMRIVGI